MTELTNYKSVNIDKLKTDLNTYKYNPSAIQRLILDYLDEVTNGNVNIVDPTNPFVFLLEASAVNTSIAVTETYVNSRKQYPSLSQTEDEIYMHLCDKDFINRFSTPSETTFTFVVSVNDIYNKMVLDSSEGCFKATIARDTKITIDNTIFTLQYPIDIRKYSNGVVQVSYDNSVLSPLQSLSNNIIEYSVRTDNDSVQWMFFNIPVKQFNISDSYYEIQRSITFDKSMVYEDKYYHCRVFYKNNNTNNTWVEIRTTHTDQVYDPNIPTAVLKVYTGVLNVFIPSVYINNNLISGNIRIDIYTTKGDITLKLENYSFTSFSTDMTPVDEERDINEYTTAFNDLAFYVYSNKVVTGGTDGIDFDELRERTITNSLGDNSIPITNAQLVTSVNNEGFDLVKNVDVITNRIFLATKKLPTPTDSKLLTSANIGISTFNTTLSELREYSKVKDNVNRFTILSNNLFKNNNGILSLLKDNEISYLNSLQKSLLVENVNDNRYQYNPFYYVLVTDNDEFEIRPYHLDQPVVSNLSFISQNQSIQLTVNTNIYNIEKIESGYRLFIETKSGVFYKQLANNLVDVQLGYYPDGEKILSFISSNFIGTTAEGERQYYFDIETNYDIDVDNLCITNSHMFNNEQMNMWTNLNSKIHIFYTTTSITDNFVSDEADSLIGKFMLPTGSVAVTHEVLDITFGYRLKNLWSRSRTMVTGLSYETYEDDIPLRYTETVYSKDPVTGSIFSIVDNKIQYNILHNKGDIVKDSNNLTVYKYKRGDVKLDESGNPIKLNDINSIKEMDLLFIDGKYYFATDSSYIEYRKEISSVLNTWITNSLNNLQEVLLEQTKLYFYPKTTLGMINVIVDANTTDYLTAEQSFTIDLYVKNNIYSDNNIRKQLRDDTLTILDKYINLSTVNITEITTALKNHYGDSVTALNVSGLGGDKNYKVVSLSTDYNRLCLKKKLVLQDNGSLITEEDVTVNFYDIELKIS